MSSEPVTDDAVDGGARRRGLSSSTSSPVDPRSRPPLSLLPSRISDPALADSISRTWSFDPAAPPPDTLIARPAYSLSSRTDGTGKVDLEVEGGREPRSRAVGVRSTATAGRTDTFDSCDRSRDAREGGGAGERGRDVATLGGGKGRMQVAAWVHDGFALAPARFSSVCRRAGCWGQQLLDGSWSAGWNAAGRTAEERTSRARCERTGGSVGGRVQLLRELELRGRGRSLRGSSPRTRDDLANEVPHTRAESGEGGNDLHALGIAAETRRVVGSEGEGSNSNSQRTPRSSVVFERSRWDAHPLVGPVHPSANSVLHLPDRRSNSPLAQRSLSKRWTLVGCTVAFTEFSWLSCTVDLSSRAMDPLKRPQGLSKVEPFTMSAAPLGLELNLDPVEEGQLGHVTRRGRPDRLRCSISAGRPTYAVWTPPVPFVTARLPYKDPRHPPPSQRTKGRLARMSSRVQVDWIHLPFDAQRARCAIDRGAQPEHAL